MSIVDHLEDLRWHILRSLIAIGVFAIAAFVYIREIIEKVILAPFSPDFPLHRWLCQFNEKLCFKDLEVDFQATEPYEQFIKALVIAFFAGLIVAFPYIVWEFWRFIKPGLTKKERRRTRGSVFVISILFFAGLMFGYYIIAPFSISFLSSFKLSEVIVNRWKIGKVVTLVVQCAVASGLLFQLPVITYYLSKVGILTPQIMRTYRRHAVVILLVISAIITPPDWVSQVLIFFPLMALYEVSIKVSGIVHRRYLKTLKEEEKAREKAYHHHVN